MQREFDRLAHARLSHAHWLGTARQRMQAPCDGGGVASALAGAAAWRRIIGEAVTSTLGAHLAAPPAIGEKSK